MTVRDGGRVEYRGRIGIERAARRRASCSRRSRGASRRGRARRQPHRPAARHAEGQRLGALRALQRQDADAQRARLRDRAADRALREPHALRRAHAQRARAGRLRPDGAPQARRRPRRRRQARQPARVDLRLAGAQEGHAVPAPTDAQDDPLRGPERGDLSPRRRAAVREASPPPSGRSTAAASATRGGAGGAHLDEAAAVDFVLLNELFKNQDAFRGSTYLARGGDGRWRLGPLWDFDISMGNSDYGESARRPAARCSRAGSGRAVSTATRGFVRALAARWRERAPQGLAGHLQRRRAARHAGRADRERCGGAQLPPLARARAARVAEPGERRVADDVRRARSRALRVVAARARRVARPQRRPAAPWPAQRLLTRSQSPAHPIDAVGADAVLLCPCRSGSCRARRRGRRSCRCPCRRR